ncbi:MAG TPA: LuxR C-terminal-related transcriptional regulator [Novosphingobium sp.]
MDRRGRITLIDGDPRRRAKISRFFLGIQFHTEPFEHESELEDHWPTDGHIVVHDSGERVAHLAARLPAMGIWLPIIAYSESLRPDRIVDAILEGAVDYWMLPFDETSARAGLERARERTASFGSTRLREADARSRVKCLSARELQVLAGMVSGLQNRSIAEKLGISPRTVEIHRAHLLCKLKVKCTIDAIRIALYSSLSLEEVGNDAYSERISIGSLA